MWEGNRDKCCLDTRGRRSMDPADTCLKPDWAPPLIKLWKETRNPLQEEEGSKVYILSGCGRWKMICVSGWCWWLWGRMPRPVSEFAKSRIYQRSPTTTQQLRRGHPGLILIPRKIQLNRAPFWSAQQIHRKFLFLSSEQLEQWDHKPNMMDSNVIKPCKGVILYPPLNLSSWTEWEKHLRYTRHPCSPASPPPPSW